MAFLSELATNASEHNIGIVIYSGNDDALVSHFSSEGARTCNLSEVHVLITFKLAVIIQVCHLCCITTTCCMNSLPKEYNVWRHSRLHETAVDTLVR